MTKRLGHGQGGLHAFDAFPGLSLVRSSKTPLPEQLYEQLQRLILGGGLKPGQAVPSTRQLADDLQIARSTVVQCYQRLITEGYLETRSAQQTMVSQNLPADTSQRKSLPVANVEARRLARLSKLGKRLSRVDLRVTQQAEEEICFYSWRPALDLVPLEDWTRAMWRQLRESDLRMLDFPEERSGSRNLREALAEHLSDTRGIVCAPAQVLITLGFVQALDIISRVHVDPGDQICLENPGFPDARSQFSLAEAIVLPIPVDEEGLRVDRLPVARAGAAPKLTFVTPSHQFPTGAVMPLSRRLALLAWAGGNNSYIVEDGYDSEYRYAGHAIPALKALDKDDSVIYVGTFSKVLFPALGVGYLVVPAELVDVYENARRHTCDPVPPHVQEALADFISSGQLRRHMRRMRDVYELRRATLINELEKRLGGAATTAGDTAGLYVLLRLRTKLSDREIIARAKRLGVGLVSAQSFYSGRAPGGEFVLGYGNLSEKQIAEGVKRLAQALKATR